MARRSGTQPGEPRDRILESAISLFSQRGYSAVGVREIARSANVNVSMISYYFGGKRGLLESVAAEFFNRYSRVFEGVHDAGKPKEECIRALIGNIVAFFRQNREVTNLMFTEPAFDSPEMIDFKAARLRMLFSDVTSIVSKLGLDPTDRVALSVIGPSIAGIVLSHFRMRDVIAAAFDVTIDDEYYERYVAMIGRFVLRGIEGIASGEVRREE